MGKKLEKYYDYVEELLGREGKMKLARLTHTPSILVGGMEDEPKIIAQFREAIKEITGKYPP